MELILRAKVQTVLSMQTGVSKNGKEWAKATVIVTYGDDPKYPKDLALSNFKNADKFSELTAGGEYDFWIEPTSREFNGKWYSEVGCWKWAEVASATPRSATPAPAAAAPADISSEQGGGEELPF